MPETQRVEPTFCNLGSIQWLMSDAPWFLSDLDGTHTQAQAKLLLGIFAEDVDIGRLDDRDAIDKAHQRFLAKGKRKEDYDPHLLDLGQLYALWMHHSGKTQAEVMQLSDNWFRRKGYKEVLRHARPTMIEATRFRFNKAFVTGAPWEVAYPFAKYLGVENVFAMMAEVDSAGLYTGKMQDEKNTGRKIGKQEIVEAFRKSLPVGIGMGDTTSDFPLCEAAYMVSNEKDVKGRGIMINSREDVLSELERRYKVERRKGQIQVVTMEQVDWELEETMRIIRNSFEAVLTDNDRWELLLEMHEARPFTPAEKEAVRLKRATGGPGWYV